MSDLIEREYSKASSVADFQLIDDYKILQKTLEKSEIMSEQKSVLIEELRKHIWPSDYEIIKDRVISSDQYNKITLHSND